MYQIKETVENTLDSIKLSYGYLCIWRTHVSEIANVESRLVNEKYNNTVKNYKTYVVLVVLSTYLVSNDLE